MSYQAQTAVTLHSKQTNVKRLRLLMYLANGANAAGIIDPAPNQDTLADFIGCSSRSIRTMLNDLQADGELLQTRIGSGPGNPSAYKITLPMVETSPEGLTPKAENGGSFDDKGGRKAETNTDFFATFEAFKAEVKAEIFALKAEVNQLKAENSEPKGGKVEAERRKPLSTESADDPYYDPYFDPILIQEEGEGNPPPPPIDYDLVNMVNALVDSTGMSGHKFWAQLSGEARDLLDGGYTAVEILEFYMPADEPPGWNWFHHDWRGRKGDRPKLKDIWETVSGARKGVPAVALNGARSGARTAADSYAEVFGQ